MLTNKGRVVRGDSFDVIYESKYDHWPEKYGSEAFFLHRVDLHNGLKALALETKPRLQAAKLSLSSEVVDVNCETGTITLATGKTSKYDVVVVADGVHVRLPRGPILRDDTTKNECVKSRFIRKVIGHDIPAEATGHSAFRFLIPMETLLQSKVLRPLFENVPPGITINTLGDRRLVWYPCRS